MKEEFIDMHCHIIPGVDDGAKDFAEAKAMLKKAYKEGIRCMIATPHYHPYRGRTSRDEIRKKAKRLRAMAHEIDPDFHLYLGNEVYYGQDIVWKLKEEKVMTMNRREYVLVEFPSGQSYSYIRQGIQQLQIAGYKVILAHIERYACIVEEPELAEELYDMGVYIQVNTDSITGKEGRKIRRFTDRLLEDELVFCVGTDAHGAKKRPPEMKKAAAYVKKRCGKEYMRQIFYENAKLIVRR